MTDSEIEKSIEQIRELLRAARAAESAANRMEAQLEAAGVKLTHHLTHTAWTRVRAPGSAT